MQLTASFYKGKGKKRKKHTITYERYNVNEVNLAELLKEYTSKSHKNRNKVYKIGNGKTQKNIIDFHCSFDIETTRIDEHSTFMYGWQFGIDNVVIWGTYWNECIKLLDELKKCLKKANTQRIICFVANLGYEWSFIKNHLTVTDSFFKEIREPVMIEHDEFIQFRECLSWGGSLQKLANDYTDLIKMKGDLDYSIYRESYNDFTNEQEWKYIDFDVLILTHFHKFFCESYLIKGYIPITVQSVLRHNMIERANGRSLAKLLPRSYAEYSTLVNWVYRGGYVHANETYINQLLDNEPLWSFDFTSSYPSVCLTEKFPYKFTQIVEWKDKETIVNSFDFENRAFFGRFVFYNLRSTTNHSIESTSKARITGKYVEDNGRIKHANKIETWLTEQDFLTYKEFYSWDKMKVLELYVSTKEILPRYLIDELCKAYTNKAILKQQGKNYAIEKAYCNSLYGVCVTKEVETNITIVDGEPVAEKRDMEDVWQKKRQDKNNKCILLPCFGVWISAYARRFLLSTVYKLETSGNPVLYCDTDSIKFYNFNNGKKIIEEYNQKKQVKIKQLCEYYNLDWDIYWDLGSFDCEYENGIKAFKTLGAKRYLHYYEDKKGQHFQCTVAGLPKKVYIERHTPKEGYKDFFTPFVNGLCEKKVKLGSDYNDNGFTMFRLGKTEQVLSCVTLNELDFNMTVNPDWLARLFSSTIKERRVL